MTQTTASSVQLVTEVPGPRSRAIMERKAAVVASGISIHAPIVVESAQGALMTDVDGNTFLDFSGGIGCMNVGHSNPRVVEAIVEQARRFTHTAFMIAPYESYVTLAERLVAGAPMPDAKVALFNSGAEAVENAVKIAKAFTGRSAIICFDGAFHGRTHMGMSLTSKVVPYKAGFGPFVNDVHRLPFPSPFHCDGDHQHGDACAETCLATLRRAFVNVVAPDEVAAIIFEPVQGEGGFVVPPRRFVEGLRGLCDEHGIVLIVDEVQSGAGRTGTLWAIEQFGVEPDLMTTAKSIAGGMPLSGVIGRASIMDAPGPAAIGGTFVGNPVACEAAIATLDELEGGLIQRGAVVGERLRAAFEGMAASDAGIGDVRGLGPMLAIELVDDAGAPDTARAGRVVQAALQRGLLLLKSGAYGNCIRVLVPLCITDEQVDESVAILRDALAS